MFNIYTIIIPISAAVVLFALHKYAVKRAEYLVENHYSNFPAVLAEEESVMNAAPVSMPLSQPEPYVERRAAA